MGRKLSIVVEEADRGNVIRHSSEDDEGKAQGSIEIIEGVQGSVNLPARTRRRVNAIVAEWAGVTSIVE